MNTPILGWYALLPTRIQTDEEGNLQIDVLSSALPTDAATQTTLAGIQALIGALSDPDAGTVNKHLTDTVTALQLIDDLQGALNDVGNDELRVLVHTALPTGDNNIGNVDIVTMPAVDTELPAAGTLTDGASNPTTPAIGSALLTYNNSTWDRCRGNIELTLLASAARSINAASANQTNYNARGVMVFINITAGTGGSSIEVFVQGIDPVSSTYVALLRSGPLTEIGTHRMVVYPGATDVGSGLGAENDVPLPRSWRIHTINTGGGSYTFSVGACLIL